MSTIEDVLFARLSGFAGLTALVSTRIYPLKLPQSPVYPACVYLRASTGREQLMGNDAGIVRPRFQVSTYAQKYSDATSGLIETAEQVRLALQRYRATVSGFVIEDIYLLTENDAWSDEPPVYARHQDFEIVYEGQ